MTAQAEPIVHQLTVQEQLQMIIDQLKLLNLRYEEATETHIDLEDIE